MAVSVPHQVATDTGAPEVQFPARDSQPHTGPVSRLLAKVSKWPMEYANYQMETGLWRKLAL